MTHKVVIELVLQRGCFVIALRLRQYMLQLILLLRECFDLSLLNTKSERDINDQTNH